MDFTKRIQKYVNHNTVEDALRAGGYDIVQPKYDGWWARVVIEGGEARVYSRQGQLKRVMPVPADTPDAVLIGEYLVGTQRATAGSDSGDNGRVIVFDCISVGSCDLQNQPYYARLAESLKVIRGVEWLAVAEGWNARAAHDKWEEWVENGGAEGVILRNSMDNYSRAKIGRVKAQATVDYVVMRVVEGGGRLRGRMGAAVCGLYVAGRLVEKVRVGGGWSDGEREAMFRNPEQFIGKVLEVRGYQVFASGAVRHPNANRGSDGAIRWRDDKRADECVWGGR